MKVIGLVVVMMLVAVSAFAGGHEQPQLNGEASVTSGVSGAVMSGNFGSGISFAVEKAQNTSYAGFGTAKIGNEVIATTYGGSSGSTFGLAYHGIAIGSQGGSFSASAHMSIPKH